MLPKYFLPNKSICILSECYTYHIRSSTPPPPVPSHQTSMQVNTKATVTSTTAITIGKTPSSCLLPSSFSSGYWVSDHELTDRWRNTHTHTDTHSSNHRHAHLTFLRSFNGRCSKTFVLKQQKSQIFFPLFFPSRENFLVTLTNYIDFCCIYQPAHHDLDVNKL